MDKTQVGWGEKHTLHALGGVFEQAGVVGTKTWAHTAGGATPLLVLWSAATGALQAVVEAFALGQLRTAAMSGVATDLLAATDATHAALLGTGKQALPQLAAVIAVRDVASVRVFSPTPEHRRAFVADAAAAGCRTELVDCDDVRSAVDGASVVTTVTRATQPFLHAEMLVDNAHVNAVGAISPERAELTSDVYERAALVVTDTVESAERLATEIPSGVTLRALADVSLDPDAGRGAGITVFKAMGIGLADVALGSVLLERIPDGVGRPIPIPAKLRPDLFGGQP